MFTLHIRMESDCAKSSSVGHPPTKPSIAKSPTMSYSVDGTNETTILADPSSPPSIGVKVVSDPFLFILHDSIIDFFLQADARVQIVTGPAEDLPLF